MNYQPLTLTCECGYRTPAVGRNGLPLTAGAARGAFKQHKCVKAPRVRRRMVVPCGECGREREVYAESAHRADRCPSCAHRDANIRRQSDIDVIAVERLLMRSPVRSTRAERQAAVTYLTRNGLTARQIAERARISERTVVRLRSRARAA